jgi:predicted lipid carrier protein YhbT
MATVEECRNALEHFAARMSDVDHDSRQRHTLDRSLACRVTDLDVCFRGRLANGMLTDIEQVTATKAQITLTTSSDDLVALARGDLDLASAWASSRIKINASILDLLKLKSMF